MNSTFPWRRVMQLGLGVLRLSPQEFWAMTLRELDAALVPLVPHADAPMDRGDLDALMKQFPDRA